MDQSLIIMGYLIGYIYCSNACVTLYFPSYRGGHWYDYFIMTVSILQRCGTARPFAFAKVNVILIVSSWQIALAIGIVFSHVNQTIF